MPRTIPESEREHADLALAVYVEELAVRRRVLFVGDAASAVPKRLSSVARSVDVVSPQTGARGTRRGSRILSRPWPSAQDAHSWDLVLVPDLLGNDLASAERVAEMAKWLTPRGVLVVGAEDREDGVGYHALYDLLARHFEWVRMLGQAPFAGWAVVDFQPAGPGLDVTVDGSLLGGTGEQPARFVALCAERDVVLDPYSIIQVPVASARDTAPRLPRESSREDRRMPAPVSPLEKRLRDRQPEQEIERSAARGDDPERDIDALRARVEQSERRLEQAQREIARSAQKLDEARSEADRLRRELEAARGELAAQREEAEASPVEEDYARLETALAERGREVAELRAEVERRGVLVRDLVEELRELRERGGTVACPGGSPSGGGDGENERALRAALEAARRRAVEAEAALAEATFRLDEARTEVALCRRQREAERSTAQRELANLEKRARSLEARAAEADELRRRSEARLALALEEVSQAQARARTLERELEETRGRSRSGVEPSVSGAGGAVADLGLEARYQALVAESAEREGRLYGALMLARERAAELQSENSKLVAEALRVRSERDALKIQLDRLAAETSATASDAEWLKRELAALRSRSEAERRELEELRGECEGLRLRLADAEAAIAAVRAAGALPSAATAPSGARSAEGALDAELQVRLDALTVEVASWTERAADAKARADAEARRAVEAEARADAEARRAVEAEARADAEARRAVEAEARISTRDAMIARLQSQLADAATRHDALERRGRELESKIAELRAAVEHARAVAELRAEEERRETRRVEQHLAETERARERAEREHAETRRALREVREILVQIAGRLAGEMADSGIASPAAGLADARAESEKLRRELEGREILLQSLTAQLQERDDRLRALERLYRGDGAVSADGDDLLPRLLHAEERVSRLERELEQERSARRVAEAGAAERDAELRRLHQMLGERDAQLMALEGRLSQGERETTWMRDALAQAQAGLELLLGEILNDQRAEAADRIAGMLRLLRRD
jgi:chromosome segregation ATPase